MNSPVEDIDLKPEKLEEEKGGGALFHCDLYDMDIVHKIAQEFLPGLASACVDNTTGGLFSSPASVAVEIRREMVDHLVQRSENFVAEAVVLEGGPNEEMSKDPYDIISEFVDDFTVSKRNFFSRVSGWLLSERREDRIDDFVQEMEINGFWLLNRREAVAQTLLKNADFKNMYHCSMNFKSLEDLAEHKLTCRFRTMTCTNEGCNSRFSAAQRDRHDSICPFKVIKCEQNCSDSIMRREMDRHCITVCPMKLVKCPFYSVGCHSSIPQSTVNQHRSENLSCHLLYILQVVRKEASAEDLKERVEELMKLSSPGQLAEARDARSLTFAIKDLEAKLGPLKVKTTAKSTDEVSDSTDKKEESSDFPSKEANVEESPTAKRESDHSSLISSADPCQERENLVESPTNVSVQLESEPSNGNAIASLSVEENLKESPLQKEDLIAPNRTEESFEENLTEPVKNGHFTWPIKAEEHTSVAKLDSQPNNKSSLASISVQENLDESLLQKEEGLAALTKVEVEIEKSSEGQLAEALTEEHFKSPTKAEEHTYSVGKREGHVGSTAQNEVLTESPRESSN